MDGPTIVQSLIARGYNPVQAAALGGHIIQESGGDAANVNPKEDAHGLLQWRLDRWDNLQKFAKDRGASATDPNVQLDFIGHEMRNNEAKAGSAFANAGEDLPAASAALKKYIRFGDDSDATRLNNARGLMGLPGVQNAGMISPVAAGPVTPGSTVTAAASGQAPAAADPDNGNAALMAQLQAIPKMLATQQQSQQFAPPAPVANNMAARLAAIAAAKQGAQ